MKSNRAFVRNPSNGYFCRAILVSVTSDCRVKKVNCKTSTGTLSNSIDQDQTPHNAASDEGLHCLLKLRNIRVKGVFSLPSKSFFQPTLKGNRPTSAVSALIQRCVYVMND